MHDAPRLGPLPHVPVTAINVRHLNLGAAGIALSRTGPSHNLVSSSLKNTGPQAAGLHFQNGA